MSEKADTILVTHREEDFEFGEPAMFHDGRVVLNCKNQSHECPAEHVYPMFFEVVETSTGMRVVPVSCGGPSDEHRKEPCKHREAVADSSVVRSEVLWVALGIDVLDIDGENSEDETTERAKNDDGKRAVAADGGVPDSDRIKRVREEKETTAVRGG